MTKTNSEPIHQYWLEISDISIFDAAFWMLTGDPLPFRNSDLDYHYDFKKNKYPPQYVVDFTEERGERGDGDSVAILEKANVIKSAIRANLIRVTADHQYAATLEPNEFIIGPLGRLSHIYISKSDWLEWCQHNGYADLVERFRHPRKPFHPHISENSPTVPAQKSTNSDAGASSQLDTKNMAYWRAILNSNIQKIDANGSADCRKIIKYLKDLNDKRILDTGSIDELIWIDDYGTQKTATKKTVSNAVSDARKNLKR